MGSPLRFLASSHCPPGSNALSVNAAKGVRQYMTQLSKTGSFRSTIPSSWTTTLAAVRAGMEGKLYKNPCGSDSSRNPRVVFFRLSPRLGGRHSYRWCASRFLLLWSTLFGVSPSLPSLCSGFAVNTLVSSRTVPGQLSSWSRNAILSVEAVEHNIERVWSPKDFGRAQGDARSFRRSITGESLLLLCPRVYYPVRVHSGPRAGCKHSSFA